LHQLERHFLACDGPAPGNHYLLKSMYEEAARDSHLMMDGIGGDYTLNPRGHAAIAWQLRQGRFRSFLTELVAWHVRSGRSYASILMLEVIPLLLPVGLRNALRRLRHGYSADRAEPLLAPDLMHRLTEEGRLGRARPAQKVPPTQMRAGLLASLRHVSQSAWAGGTRLPSVHGLDFTRPFHDRRVVELGLAIPEHLYVVGGRNRYLACQALADIYPGEFLTRDRGNEALTPNIPAELEPLMPAMAEEAQRLALHPRLTDFFNLAQAGPVLNVPTTRLDEDGLGRQVRAVHALMMARFVEWFERGQRNDLPPD
jgi:asparagine synthase (glutamine-hydrolysing)